MDTSRLRALLLRTRSRLRRIRQDWRRAHVPERCASLCDCPCGYCRHDRRHVPGCDWPTFDTAGPVDAAADVAADRHNRGER